MVWQREEPIRLLRRIRQGITEEKAKEAEGEGGQVRHTDNIK